MASIVEPVARTSHAPPFRLAMLGMVDGNGHPYSWSAMFNGYDPQAMADCPYPAIPAYLAKEPPGSFGIANASVTHVWTDDPSDAPKVAAAARIPNVVRSPKEVIGQVDAVIVATDKGHEHVDRCRPFVEAGLPMFVDKPLVDNEPDLRTFVRWVRAGGRIMSSSCMRYCKEFAPYRLSTHNLGALRLASITTCKSWERYGIHAMEGVYSIIGPGFETVRNIGTRDRNIIHLKHRCGADVIVAATDDMYGGFGCLQLIGTAGHAEAAFSDTFYSFRSQLAAFVENLTTGNAPFPFEQTVELMKIIIAGIVSRNESGREIALGEIVAE